MIYLLCNPFATILATDGSATPPLLIITNLMLSGKTGYPHHLSQFSTYKMCAYISSTHPYNTMATDNNRST
jgi:hypothetical protein